MKKIIKVGLLSASLLPLSFNAMAEGTHFIGFDLKPYFAAKDAPSQLNNESVHFGFHYGHEWAADSVFKPVVQIGYSYGSKRVSHGKISVEEFKTKIGAATYEGNFRFSGLLEAGAANIKASTRPPLSEYKESGLGGYIGVGFEAGYALSKHILVSANTSVTSKFKDIGLSFRYGW